MAFEERRAWIQLAVSIVGYAAYLAIILSHGPREHYAWTLVWTVVGAVGAAVVAEIVTSAVSPPETRRKDQRDQEITQFGDRISYPFVVIGALGALILALFEADHFWIANAVYLAFVLSAVFGSMARIAGYRHGFQS